MSVRKKWNDSCDFCGGTDDECSFCHDTYQHAPDDCPHGEDHAQWYFRHNDHSVGTTTIKYDCGLCGDCVVARVEALDDRERGWDDICGALQEFRPDLMRGRYFPSAVMRLVDGQERN